MNGWLILVVVALAVAVGFAYLAGRITGLGCGEQDRGDLAEKNNRLLDTVRQLEARVIGQHQRIVAMTAWETMPWPDGRTSLVPVRPREALLPSLPAARVSRPRRERRTSTAAFLSAPAAAPERHWHGSDWACDGMCDPPPWEWRQDVGEATVLRVQADAATDPQRSTDRNLRVGNPLALAHPAPEVPEQDSWWPQIEDEIWSFKMWLATL